MIMLGTPEGDGITPESSEEQVAREISKLTERAWNHSRPFAEEAEFSEMTVLFQERLQGFATVLIMMMGQEG